jgi:hypothetical protein
MYHKYFNQNLDYYHFIYDIDELKYFFDKVLPPLSLEENYFISLSCRKKYFDGNSKWKIQGTSEMFERRLIREHDWNLFLRTIYKYQACEGSYTDKENNPMDPNSMIIYINFNPCNVIKAYQEFMIKTNENLMNLIFKVGSSLDYFKHIDRKLMTAMHHARGIKHYIDIDIDYKPNTKNTALGINVINFITDFLKSKKINFYVIDTHGGYHILMKYDSVHFDYMTQLKLIQSQYSEVLDDIMNNAQGMIPVPGCLQASYPVLINKSLSNIY